MQDPNDWPIAYGVLTTVAAGVAWLVWYITGHDSPVNRRAWRAAIVVGLLFAALVAGAEWWLYTYVNVTIGSFMLFPSVILGALAMWLAGRATFQVFGGYQEEESEEDKRLPSIEDNTRDHQGEIWCRLRALPHMREALNGDLINLATADVVSWGKYKGERCIMFNLGGKSGITGVRYETLTQYLAVQEGMARLLCSEGISK